MMGYFWLGYVRVNERPAKLENEPAGLEHPARARNRSKATVKIQRNRPLPILSLIRYNLLIITATYPL